MSCSRMSRILSLSSPVSHGMHPNQRECHLRDCTVDEEDEWRTRVAAGVLVGSGTICVGHGTARYFSTLRLLKEGLFRPNVPGITLAAGASIAIAVAGGLLVADKDGRERLKEQAKRQTVVVETT